MPTIAIIGAGPGLGLALAKKFGQNGYNAALIARNPDTLDTLVNDPSPSMPTSARASRPD